MFRIGILLLGMASLVASGILIDRNRFGLYQPYQAGVSLNAESGLGEQNFFSRDELLRQKFILDILQQINLPLENQDLLQLGYGVITNENLYIQPLDEDMLFVLDLIRNNQMLGKHQACSIGNDRHLRQMVGLYKLFLKAQDFKTLQRLIVYGRQNIQTELFVNSLILALGERSDTNMLIIPALYEILPHLYHDEDLIKEIRNIDEQNLVTQNDGISSLRPNLLDIITLSRQNRLYNTQRPESSGMINILNRSELWMPWRRLHQQLALNKALQGRIRPHGEENLRKLVISIPAKGKEEQPLGLFTEDLGLKSYLNILIDELIVKQDLTRIVERDQLQYSNSRDEYTTENRERDLLQSQRSEGLDRSTNTDELLYAGRRIESYGKRLVSQQETNTLAQRSYGNRLDDENINNQAARELYATETNDPNIPYAGRRLRNRFAARGITTLQDEYRHLLAGRGNDIESRFVSQQDTDQLGQRSYGLNYANRLEDDDENLNKEAAREMYVTESNEQNIPYAGRGLRNRYPISNNERRINMPQEESLTQTQDSDIPARRKDDSVKLNDDRLFITEINQQNVPYAGRGLRNRYTISNNERRINTPQDEFPKQTQDSDIPAGRQLNDDRLFITETNQQNVPYAGQRLRNRYPISNNERRINTPQEESPTQTLDSNMLSGRKDDSVKFNDDRLFITETNEQKVPYAGQRLRNRYSITNNERRIITPQEESLTQTQDSNMLAGRRDDSLKSNDNLLYVGRRLQNIGGFGESYNDDDTISSGRHVARDEQRDSRKDNRRDQRKEKNDEDSQFTYRRQNPYNERQDNQDEAAGIRGSNPGYRLYEQQQESYNKRSGNNDYLDRGLYYRQKYGQGVTGGIQGFEGQSSLIGQGRNAFLDTIYRGNEDQYRIKQGNILRNDDEIYQQSELPTTSNNDERFLYINRRRLNEVPEGRRVGNFGDDEYQRKNSLFGRSRLTNEEEGDRKYVDRDGDSIRRYPINEQEGDRKYVDRDGDNIGRGNLYNSRGYNEEEGNRKYVDRDDDGMRGGSRLNRRDRYAEEGDRKYLDRDDDGIRGSNLYNRRVHNTEEVDRKYVDRDDDGIREINLLNRRVRNTEEGDRKYVDRDDDGIRGGNRRAHNTEEGNRRYVDRDDDGIHGGSRRAHNTEEGDRKYVDRDDDRIRGGNLLNRRGRNAEEGDRKYVDRNDDDGIRGGYRRAHNTEEGDRKYVDRDDDGIRGGSRRAHNTEEGDRKYVDRDDDDRIRGGQNIDRQSTRRANGNDQSQQTFRRYRRSLGNEISLNGRLLIHNLQQLAARINIQRISLGQSEKIEDYFQPRNDRRLINDISQGTSLNPRLDKPQDLLILEKINDIYQRLDELLLEEIPRLAGLTNEEQINEIGLLLAKQIHEIGLLDILSEILQLDNHKQEAQLTNLLAQPLHQLILCRLVDILDKHLKQLPYDRDISFKGLNINNIKVGRLETYMEYSEVDLTNLLIDHSDMINKKMVVGRIPRLNHKSFNIKLDIESDRQQQVVIRTFLGPKLDARGNILSLLEQRQNYILLDIRRNDLKEGRNFLKLKSNDISWTSRDTTPRAEIYERVMRALDNDLILMKDLLIGQSNLYPHRLLIPRGLINGLPMQLLTVITPLEQGSDQPNEQHLTGLAALQIDRLPLNYPLDGDIQDLQSFLTLPNVFLKDVSIYHDDNISNSRML